MAKAASEESISTTATEAQLVLPDVGQRSPSLGPARSSELPEELVERAAQRLGVFAAAIALVAVIETFASHAYESLHNSAYPTRADHLDLIGVAITIALSAAMWLLVRAGRTSSRRIMRLGHGYLIVLAYVVSCTDHADYFWRNGNSLHGLPVIVVLILTFPVLIPTTRIAAWRTGFAMAFTGPLSIWTLCALLDYEQPGGSALLESFPWLGAGLAGWLAGIVHDLGTALKRAQTLGVYTLEERLGGGGMGEVYRARHMLLMRAAAIKLIRPARAPDPTTRERFKREARATAALKSPHTVELYDFGVSQAGSFYYVMELLDGFDLENFVHRYGPQEPARVLFWLKQTCHSLREAHAMGLVHRDIKPANLIVCRYGLDYDFVKLLDFGLVSWRAPLQLESAQLSGAEEIRGTPAYMAPELVLQNAPLDGRADLYALGCVAFWLLTGRNVFEGKTAIEIIIAHVHHAPPAPSAFTSNPIPPELERIILGCLAKSPDHRPASAAELLEQLEQCACEPAWDDARAEAWWSEHVPAK